MPAIGKRILVAVDVRNPMVHSKVQGCPQLTPALASALVILPMLHVEDNLTVVAFSQGDMSVLDLKKDMNLLDITKKMREVSGRLNLPTPNMLVEILWNIYLDTNGPRQLCQTRALGQTSEQAV